jgi:hypothetical protein
MLATYQTFSSFGVEGEGIDDASVRNSSKANDIDQLGDSRLWPVGATSYFLQAIWRIR